MTWQVSLVPQEEVRAVWPKVAPLLAPAMRYAGGRIDLRTIYEEVQAERQNLWVAYDEADRAIAAAFVTHVAKYAKCSVLVIDCAGGSKMRHWLHPASTIFRKCARDLGAVSVQMYGREGWIRVLKSCGWQQKLVVMEVDAALADEGV